MGQNGYSLAVLKIGLGSNQGSTTILYGESFYRENAVILTTKTRAQSIGRDLNFEGKRCHFDQWPKMEDFCVNSKGCSVQDVPFASSQGDVVPMQKIAWGQESLQPTNCKVENVDLPLAIARQLTFYLPLQNYTIPSWACWSHMNERFSINPFGTSQFINEEI